MSASGNGLLSSINRLTEFAQAIGVDVGSYRLSLYGLISAVVVGVFLYMVVRLTLRLIKWVLRRNQAIDETQRLLVEKLTGIVLFGFAALVGIDLLGIDLTALAVFSGALGLAIGFGLQKTVGNLIAGIILLMDRSIKPGDVISVGDPNANSFDTPANVGRVQRIGVRAVSVVTRDGKKHLIPNELLMTQPVENWSYFSRDVRVRMRVPVGYDTDLRLAQRLMMDAAKANPRVLNDPEPVVWIIGFGERAVDHELRLWIADPEAGLGNIQGEVYLAIWDAFAANGIRIPAPRSEVAIIGSAPLSRPMPVAPSPPRRQR
jgi:small-conductance mechanosensitive channel